MATENTIPGNEASDEPSLRDTIDAAFEQHATDEVDDKKPAAPAQAPAQADPADPAEPGTGRDEKGRFAPKQGGAPAAPAQEQTQADPNAAPAPSEIKPPASWNPTAREKWSGVDPEIRAEVHRREREMQQVLQQGAQARGFIQAFENVVRPYEVFIRQENSNPLQAVQNMMQTAATLRVGTPQDKAALVAGLVSNFGIDIVMLDTLLAGKAVNGGLRPQQEFRDPRVDQLLQQRQQEQQQSEQSMRHELATQLQSFADAHEFFGDVQQTMADLMELRGKHGQKIDIEDAYKQACQMHEGVSKILAQRATQANNGTHSQAVLRAKRAAASVKGDTTPHSGATVPKNDSVRASIEAAIESLS
jgi:hypothetical protein